MASDQTTQPPRYEDIILRRSLQRWEACESPKAWAQYRDGAAKALPWFPLIQGGVSMTTTDPKRSRYSKNQYITGILIDGFGAQGSYLDAEVIITSIHGARTTPTVGDEKRRDALKLTQEEKRLVGCIAGEGSVKPGGTGRSVKGNKTKFVNDSQQSHFPCPMPKNQNCWVLDFYIITDSWKAVTKDGPVTMARLERWKLENKAWFASKDDSHNPPPLSARDFTTKAPRELCQSCGTTSPRMYEEHFLCRNQACDAFWQKDGKVINETLTYTTAFLQQRDPRPQNGFQTYGAYKGDSVFPELAPFFEDWWQQHYNKVKNKPITKEGLLIRMKALNTGFWCPDCGMLNRRLKWHKWHCVNGNCNFARTSPPTVMTAADIAEIDGNKPTAWSELSGYAGQEDKNDGFTRYNYDFGNGCGVSVLRPQEGTNSREHGSDWMFSGLQAQANQGTFELEKQFIGTTSEGTVSNHFIHNLGREYKLSVNIKQTTSFDNAPEELQTVLQDANTLCRQYQTTAGEEDFNQCYIAGYFTDNQMGWHSDGETGLGSVIATYTLGTEGEMSIGPNNDQYWGTLVMKKGEEDPVLPGVKHEEKRRALKAELDAKLAAHSDLSNPDDEKERTAARQVYRSAFAELFAKDRRPVKAKPHTWLKLPLTHGSIVVMHGPKFQKYFEHQVQVKSPLRFALTLRHISAEHSQVAKATNVRNRWEYPHFPDTTYLDEFRGVVAGDESEPAAKRRKLSHEAELDREGSEIDEVEVTEDSE